MHPSRRNENEIYCSAGAALVRLSNESATLVIGLRIYGNATFAEIFQPILSRMNGLVWVVDLDEWVHPTEWEDASEFDPDKGWVSGPWADFDRDFRPVRRGSFLYGYVSTADIFPEYAPIIGDRQTVYGLRLTPDEAEQWLVHTVSGKSRDETPPYVTFVDEAEITFLGHESWREFYAKDASLMEAMKAYIPRTDEVRANPTAYTLSAAYEECSSTEAT